MDLITKIRIDNVQEAENILKAAGSEELLEKAHQDGDIHPRHPDWVWVSSASGGKGDWRKAGGRAHKKHQASQGSQGDSGTQGGQDTSDGSKGTPNAEKPSQKVGSTSSVVKKLAEYADAKKTPQVKADVPYENLKTIDETIAYAKTLSDFTFKDEESGWGSKGRAFSLTNKNGLKMTVDFIDNSEYIYNFEDKDGNSLYSISSTEYNSRTNWKDLLNPKTWSSKRMSELKTAISKYETASRRAKTQYDRYDRNSDYQKYLNNESRAHYFSRRLEMVKKIAALS